MRYPALVAELTADPLGRGYGDMTDDEVAASLNAADRTLVVTTFATWRKLLADLGPTATPTIKGKIEAAAESNAAVAMTLDMLAEYGEGGGLDLGHANTRAVIDQLATVEVLTADEAAAIKGVAEETISRAAELGLPTIKPGYVAKARAQGGLA